MAQKLHSQYGYSYSNLQVLLGGWNTWNENHQKDPKAYPVDGTPVAPQQQLNTNGTAIPAPSTQQVITVLTPGANLVTGPPTPSPK